MTRTQVNFILFSLPALVLLYASICAARDIKKPAEVLNIRTVPGPDSTRVIVDLTGKPEYSLRQLENPPELQITLPGTFLSKNLKKAVPVNDAHIKEIKALQINRTALLAIRLQPAMGYRITFSENAPFMITIDIKEEKKLQEEAGQKPEEKAAAAKAGGGEEGGFHLGGYVKNETAYRISSPDQLTKIRNLFFLGGDGALTPDISYKASGRVFYDAVYALTRNYPSNVRHDQEFEADVRDFYLDISKGNWDVRLGSQQIVWGEAVGLFFADVVNAKDLREFVLPDFDYIRIPDWAAEVEYTRDKLHLELVWIPVLKFDRLGLPGSEFVFPLALPQGVAANVTDEKKPPSTFKNSEAGLRLSYLLNGWDFSVFHMHTWDKLPTEVRTIIAPTLYTFSPEHRKIEISGLTVAKEIKDTVFKGEFVYYWGKFFSVIDPSNAEGLVKKDYLDYLLSADHTFFEKVDVNVQFMQRIIFNFDDRIFHEEHVRSSASLWIKTGFWDNKVEPEILFISDLMRTDMMIRPAVNLRLGRHWLLKAGVDLFEGVPDGTFGEFRNRSRAYGEVKYGF